MTTMGAERSPRSLAPPPFPLISALLTLMCLVIAGSINAEARNIFYPINQAVYFADDRFYPSSEYLPRKNYYYAVIRKRSIFNDSNANNTTTENNNSVPRQQQQQQPIMQYIAELTATTAKESAVVPQADADFATTMAPALNSMVAPFPAIHPQSPHDPPQRFVPQFALPFNRPTAQWPSAGAMETVELVAPLEIVALTGDLKADEMLEDGGEMSMMDEHHASAAVNSPSVSIFGNFQSGGVTGGCFCCRVFVCHRQRKCPCSKFIF